MADGKGKTAGPKVPASRDDALGRVSNVGQVPPDGRAPRRANGWGSSEHGGTGVGSNAADVSVVLKE